MKHSFTKKAFFAVIGLAIICMVLILISILNRHQDNGKGSPSNATQTNQITVGVNVYVQQPILESVLEGLVERISLEKNIDLEIKNSNGDAMTCQQINEQFLRKNVHAIVALGTPAAQSAISLTSTIPIVFGAITDPVGAKLADTLEVPGGNKTGTTNRWPFEEQVDYLNLMLPHAKRIGMLVNPSEANCEAGMKIIRASLQKKNISLIEIPVSSSSEVITAVRTLKGRIDAIMVSPANTVFAALDTVINEAEQMNIPVFGGDETAVKKGSIATCGFSNKDVGVATGIILLKVLENKQNAGNIPVSRPHNLSLYVNNTLAQKYKVIIPESTLPIVNF
jgi:putative ABC transport system substrate-binding protein